MTKMTHRTNLTVVVKVVDLDISCIYNHNHMVGMDKISSSDIHLDITYVISMAIKFSSAPNKIHYNAVCKIFESQFKLWYLFH
jgi:hypothetical protein